MHSRNRRQRQLLEGSGEFPSNTRRKIEKLGGSNPGVTEGGQEILPAFFFAFPGLSILPRSQNSQVTIKKQTSANL
jgi:hypothetical protein